MAGMVIPMWGAMPEVNPAATIPGGPYAEASAALGSELERAREAFSAGNYRGVIDELCAIRERLQTPLTEEATQEMVYMLGASYFHTGNSEALTLLTEYINGFLSARDVASARLLRADFFFFAHDWSEALELYKQIHTATLDSSTRELYTYREAICMIKCGFFDEARAELNKLAGTNEYSLCAKYYTAYLDYVAGRDEEAMKGFKDVEREINAGNGGMLTQSGATPAYYIAQLYFRQGDWDKAASMATDLLKGMNTKNIRGRAQERVAEEASELILPTERILGMSLYEKGEMQEALSALRRYVKGAGEDASHDALYAMGVCEYAEGEYSEAEECFSKVAGDRDAIGQGAALYLGQIAAQRGDVSVAAMNFEHAYNMNYDNHVAEAALYNYVAARARGGNIPFDSNVGMLEEFLNNYPNSEFAPVIERHLAALYYNDGKYSDALRVMRRIRKPSKSDTLLLQNILYAGGTSALSSGQPERAIEYLKECVGIADGDADVKAQAGIWLGDALYETGDYKGAEKRYQEVLKSGRAGDNKVHLLYNLGYSQMRQDKFESASKTFSDMLSSSVDISEDMKRDARLRIADSRYYAGRYSDAKNDFAPLRTGGYGADYAAYRYAQILGIEGRLGEKISELRRLEREYPTSKWMPNVLNELAETYVANGENGEAAAAYSRLLAAYPSDASAPSARLGMASALMDSGETDRAVAAYKEILSQHPSSSEARLADKALREYYADRQQLQEYAGFLKSVPGFTIDAVEMERLSYDAAERHYLSDGKIEPLKKYLADYAGGSHNAEAWLLLAHHYQDAGDTRNALAAYRELERTGGSEYASEAYAGIMRMADNSAVRADYARKLRESGGGSVETLEEADFYLNEAGLRSKSAAERKESEKALRQLASNPFSEFGARSAVSVGEYLVEQGRNKEALELMEEFTSSGSEKQYWVARGFIVMADAYYAMGDKSTAEEYLRSLQRNYPGDEEDIRRAYTQRLSRK